MIDTTMIDTTFVPTDNPLLPPPPPPWSVIEFTFSNRDTDSELVVMCNGKRFVIYLFADNFSESPLLRDRYLFFLQVAENYELDGLTVEDFYDWAVEPLFPLFRELSPLAKARKSTLHEFIFPTTLVYTLRAVSEELVPVPYGKSHMADVEPRFGVPLSDEVCTPWSSFGLSEVQICEEHVVGPPSQTPGKVLLKDGTIGFFKIMRRGDKQFLKNELEKYKKIDEAPLDNALRISRLLGLVRDESNMVFGLLLTYIDCKFVTLSCATKPETPMPLRQKWVTQLRDIVDQLHDAGIVWGDAKPDNVLIDRNEDVWVVDFGGGYTEGWVPKELAGTMEGDRYAMDQMVEFIGV